MVLVCPRCLGLSDQVTSTFRGQKFVSIICRGCKQSVHLCDCKNSEIRGRPLISTFMGRNLHPLELTKDDVCIEDIAHALSLTCRFGGHCREFFSVAQHSVHVASLCPQEHRLLGLLHDASEAYLTDLPAPIKHSEGFKHFRIAEEIVDKAIYEWAGIVVTDEMYEPIKQADLISLQWEGYNQFPDDTIHWPKNPLPDEPFKALSPREAELEFLSVWKELTR